MKNNRRILIRIVSHGLNALLKRNSLGIALYHLGSISNFVSFLLYFWAYSPSPPLQTLLLPLSPFLSCSLPPSLLFSLLYILHQILYVRRWQTTACWANLAHQLFVFWFFKILLNWIFKKVTYFSLGWVFVAARGLSSVVESRGYSSLQCPDFSLQWLLSLRSMGSRRAGFSSCGTRA